ncbi:uncharacterized protein LOC117652320 [Thrips palmi]|uniref:Uncharacterized protein LOC117652320 n=1 Tax=Thrips palmi TaxID=161013 RepID=A0A6P9AAC5_THRPL|nr:uncharacterized protein LOC117652320 [Thrips palmi]
MNQAHAGWFPAAPVSAKQAMVGLHPNVPTLRAPPLFAGKPSAAKVPEAAAAKVADEADGVLALPVLLMKCVFLWPDSQNVVTRFIANRIYPLSISVLILSSLGYIVEGNYESGMTALTNFGDALASTSCLLKLLLLSREGPQLARMRRRLQTDFAAMEGLAEPEASAANAHCTRRCRTISLRFMLFYVPLCSSAVGVIILNAFNPPEKRKLTFDVPRILVVNDFLYYPLVSLAVMACTTFYFYSVGYDALYLSLCKHMSCKCDILTLMLRRAGQRAAQRPSAEAASTRADAKQYNFEYWKDDGSAMEAGSRNGRRDEVQENLRTCVLYHNMIIRLRDEAESIFAGVSLFQMGYILLGLGIPGLRLLREASFKPMDVMFLAFYAGWNFSQLLFYCWFADELAGAVRSASVITPEKRCPIGVSKNSFVRTAARRHGGMAAQSGRVGVAALAAMRPAEMDDDVDDEHPAARRDRRDPAMVNLSKAAGTTLRLIMMRAQHPLYLTAGNFANITLELYLTIIRKSQSIYSYLIRMR